MIARNPREPDAEKPRSEPEIIPPGSRDRRGPSHIFMSVDEDGGARRVYLARPGPFTLILALAVLGLIALAVLIVLLSVALIWIPVVIALVAVFVASVTFRHWMHRVRAWWAGR